MSKKETDAQAFNRTGIVKPDFGEPASVQAMRALEKTTSELQRTGLSADTAEALIRDSLQGEASKQIEKVRAETNVLDRRYEAYVFQMRDMNIAITQLASSLTQLSAQAENIAERMRPKVSRLSWYRRRHGA